jgi:hypothetical protein
VAGFAADFFLVTMMCLLSVATLMLGDLAGLSGGATLRALRVPDPLWHPRLGLRHHQLKHRAPDSLLDTSRDALTDAAAVKQDLLSLLPLHPTLEHEIVGPIDAVLF